MKSPKNSTISQQKKAQKTTTGDEQKRYRLIKKLQSHSIQQFRNININEFDLNITEHFEELEEIDTAVTPLIYVAYYGLKDICKTLLKNQGVDVDLETENNRQTPMLAACISGNYQIVRLLVLNNAEINKPNLLNHTPLTVVLYRLVQEPHSFQNKKICFRTAQFLINHGADINWIIDKSKGYSLLHYFCSLKIKMNKSQKMLNYQIIKFLLQKGANPHYLTLQDLSCEELLEKHCNREELIELVLQHKKKEVKVQLKKIKKIEANFFTIQPKIQKKDVQKSATSSEAN